MKHTPFLLRSSFGLACLLLGGCQLSRTATTAPTITTATIPATAIQPSGTPTAMPLPPMPKLAGQIAYLATLSGCCLPSDLYMMDADGQNTLRYFSNVQSYAWSPKGDKVIADASPLGVSELFLVPMKNAESYQWGFGSEPAWSPDGATIAFEDLVYGQWGIYTRPVTGATEAKKIVNTTMGGSMPTVGRRIAPSWR
jgi:hypothetical protein